MVPPKSFILIGFSIINHPFWGTTIFGNIHIYILYIIALFAANIVPTTSVPNPESTASQTIPTIRFTGMPRWDLLTQISYEGSLKRIFPQQTSETFHVTGASPAKEHPIKQSNILYHYKYLLLSTASTRKIRPSNWTYLHDSHLKGKICANTLGFLRTQCFNINRSPKTQNGRIPQKSCKHASFEPWDFQFSNCNWYKLFINIGEETGIGTCNFKQTSRIRKNQHQSKFS